MKIKGHSPPQTRTGIDGRSAHTLCPSLYSHVTNDWCGTSSGANPPGCLSSPPSLPFTRRLPAYLSLPNLSTQLPLLLNSFSRFSLSSSVSSSSSISSKLSAGACFSVLPAVRGDGCVLVRDVRGQRAPLLGPVALLEDRFSVIPQIKSGTSKHRHTLEDIFHVFVGKSQGHQVALQPHR